MQNKIAEANEAQGKLEGAIMEGRTIQQAIAQEVVTQRQKIDEVITRANVTTEQTKVQHEQLLSDLQTWANKQQEGLSGLAAMSAGLQTQLDEKDEELDEILNGAGYKSFFEGEKGSRLFDSLWDTALKLFDDELELASLDSILYCYGNHLEGKIAEKF